MQQAFTTIQHLLAEKTAINLEDIVPETHLEAELGIDLEDDLPAIIGKVNRQFGIQLSADEVYSNLEAIPTVGRLSQLVQDELDLG